VINEQGFYQYEDYFGVVAWDEYISKSLNTQAGKAFGELTLLNYQVESTTIWPIYSKKIEAKRRTLDFFTNFNEYLKVIQTCFDAKCYDSARKTLNEANAQVAELAIKRGLPRLDIFRLKNRLNDY
jgi:hypothetical protein